MIYYWKEKGSDTYHWHLECDKNEYPSLGWKRGNKPPSGREKCNECKAKDK